MTPDPDIFQIQPDLLTNLPGGLRGLEGDDQIFGSEVADISDYSRHQKLRFMVRASQPLD